MSRTAQLQIVFYVALIVVCTLAAQAGEIRLRSQCQATCSVVRLGEVAELAALAADLHEQLHSLPLFPAPKPGLSRRVTAQDVRETLALHGISLPAVQVTGECEVAGMLGSQPIASAVQLAAFDEPPTGALASASEKLALQATAYLVTKEEARSHWKVAPLLSAEQAAAIDTMQQPEVSGGQAPWTGRQVFTVRDAAELAAEPLTFKADVTRVIQAVVTTRQLSVGDVIGPGDVELKVVSPLSVTQTALLDVNEAIGREIKRPLPAGQIVHRTAVRHPLMVKKGEQVTVYSVAAGVQVKATAKSLSAGSLGDVIVLQATESKRQFQARVTGPQEAMVFVDTPRVATDTDAASANSEVAARVR
jgi:flagella basal body P-ring formation protein FlgA